MRPTLILLACLSLSFAKAQAQTEPVLSVGSKKFTENVILGELVKALLRAEGVPSVHVRELGGTRILWKSLLSGEIAVYPEYTGTLTHEIFAGKDVSTRKKLLAALDELGLAASAPLGFNNTYALGMKKGRAKELGIARMSDLVRHPELVFGFSNEFMDRAEGWPGIRQRYRLPQTSVKGMDHDLAYRGLESGTLDVTDLYSTDAEIAYYDLAVLEDDLAYFPRYEAILVYRKDAVERYPEAEIALRRLEGQIDEERMVALNSRAKLERVPETRVAARFLDEAFGLAVEVEKVSVWTKLRQYTTEHLRLVLISLGAAIAVSVPLGILAAKLPRFGQAILAAVGVVQTIPSLALLVFMIPLLGIGAAPAMFALFLYSLLPIVRNTHQGLSEISPPLRESSVVLGLPPKARLLRIELPLASRTILAGIKTSAVINIGTATLGALVGAGGYGQPILTGIRLDDVGLILLGAVPAAVMALAVQWGFESAERWLLPRGLRL